MWHKWVLNMRHYHMPTMNMEKTMRHQWWVTWVLSNMQIISLSSQGLASPLLKKPSDKSMELLSKIYKKLSQLDDRLHFLPVPMSVSGENVFL